MGKRAAKKAGREKVKTTRAVNKYTAAVFATPGEVLFGQKLAKRLSTDAALEATNESRSQWLTADDRA